MSDDVLLGIFRAAYDGYDVNPVNGDVEFATALRAVAAIAWDASVAAMQHEDGTPVEIVSNVNPFRVTRDG